MKVSTKIIKLYYTLDGVSPFIEWFEVLDVKTQTIVDKRLDRIELGNLGDVKSVGDGVYEARIHYGPGIRIYFSMQDRKVVVLLAGGTKRTQQKDIKMARIFCLDYKTRFKGNKNV